ncbi:MAG: hypothetical protein WD995_11905 [Gemmatimonadota bacterium]
MLEPLEEEIRTLHAILGSDRDPDGRAFAPLADAYRRAGQPRKAFGLLTDGIARLPDFASGHVVAARLYAEQGLLEEGEIAARRALDLDPDNVIAMAALLRVLQSAGKTDEAAETRTMLAMLEPEVLEEEGLAEAPEPTLDVADLAPDEPVLDVAALAPDEAVLDIADLAPDEPVLDVADLAPDEAVVDVADLAPDEAVVDLADLAPDEPAFQIADPAPPVAGQTSSSTPTNPGNERRPEGERGSAADAGAGAPRIYTRTLAELYARQGFIDRAVEVFRQLRAEHPDDAGLEARLLELETQRSGASVPDSPKDPDASADPVAGGRGRPESERARTPDDELESLARDLVENRSEEPRLETPFAWAGAEEPDDEAEPAPEGPSIGTYFDELLSWQPKGRA